MSKKLKIRTLKRKKLPWGKFNFIVTLDLPYKKIKRNRTNVKEMVDVRQLCRDTFQDFKMDHVEGKGRKKVYTKIYLMNPMDVAMLKLVHHGKLRKIYKVVVDPSATSLPDELDGVIEEETKAEDIV